MILTSRSRREIEDLIESAEVWRGGDEGDTWFARCDASDYSGGGVVTGAAGSPGVALAVLRGHLEERIGIELDDDDVAVEPPRDYFAVIDGGDGPVSKELQALTLEGAVRELEIEEQHGIDREWLDDALDEIEDARTGCLQGIRDWRPRLAAAGLQHDESMGTDGTCWEIWSRERA